MKKTVVMSIRLPVELKARIEELAQKRLTTPNHWIVNALAREARPH